MAVLYQSYRPKTFGTIVNQDHIKITLQNAVRNKSFAHAYLFTGPRGTGKTSLARIFARAINCLHPENGEPCNVCEICVDFLTNRSMDLVEIDAASNTGVENIREIIEHLAFSPNRAQYKVFIIDEVHMLSKGAFNALLKTLEEPPKHAVFILATTEVHKVPPTVISRTQRFDFKKIDGEQMHKHLEMIASAEGIVIDQESLGLVVQAAEGGVRDALSILDRLSQYGSITKEIAEQLLGMTNIVSVQTLLSLLIKKDAKAALEYTEQLLLSGLDPIQFNKDLLEYLRKLLLLGSGAEASLSLAESQLVILKEQSVALSQNQLLHIIRLFLRAAKDFEISPSIELPFEIAVAESCLSNLSVLQHTATQKSVTSEKSVQYEHSNHAEMKHDTIPKPASEELNQSNVEVLEKNDEPKSSTEPEISLEILMQSWPQVLSLIKERQSAIFTLLKVAFPKDIAHNVLQISCQYKFHKDSLDILKNKVVIQSVLKEIYHTNIEVRCIIEKNIDGDRIDTATGIMEVFGSEIS